MAETNHNSNAIEPGDFSWIELATSNQTEAKRFYGSLFGWDAHDMPMGPGEVYTIFRMNGRDVAAAYTQRKEQVADGVPPNWLLYMATTSADSLAQRTTQLGGKVCAPPFDVFDAGRMAVLQDPTGAVFAGWEARRHTGLGVRNVNNAFCWADLSTPDPEEARTFYGQLLGWTIVKSEHDTSGYLHIQNQDRFIGGIQPPAFRKPRVPPHWLIYIEVADCDATARSARELGAKFWLDPMSMENVGRLAVLADPQGATFAIFQAARR